MSGPRLLSLEFARTQQAGDPYTFRFMPQDYILRGEGGAVETVRIEWSQQFLDDLSMVHQPDRDPALAQRLGDRLAAMLDSATWHAHEARLADTARSGDDAAGELACILEIRSSAAELYVLPWELLTLRDTGQPLAELRNVLVRYEWPRMQATQSESAAARECGRILFAWSATAGSVPAAQHQSAIERAAFKGAVAFEPARDALSHASSGRLVAALESARLSGPPISVLHILCHGVKTGSTFCLALNGAKAGDRADLVDAAQLRQLLAPYAGMLRLVVLMACDSSNSGVLGNHLGSIAQTLHRAGFAQVIASRFPLSVDGSIRFAESFYQQLLVSLASVEQAFLRTRALLPRDRSQLDWAGLQLYAQPSAGADSRPLVFRPYRGLLAYGPEQRRFFFGRDEEKQEILAELLLLVEKSDPQQPRLQIVEGPSGVGKSSLVLAGVGPELADRGWRWRSMRPGDAPLAALDAALQRLGEGKAAQRCLLVVDQLEEIFSQLPEARSSEREAFVQRLWQLASDPAGTVSIVCTLRTDYRGQCASIRLRPPAFDGDLSAPRLDSLFGRSAALHNTYVQQMTSQRLREVIEQPAARVGLALADGLAARMLHEVGTEPGALALIQHTLDLLWQQRTGKVLTQHAYDGLGGVTGALNRHAESVMSVLSPAELDEARRILIQLVARSGESAPYTRRSVSVAALRPASAQRRSVFEQVVNMLTEAQLLVIRRREPGASGEAEDVIEASHEALIRTWSRLREWVRDEQAFLALSDQIGQWVSEWQRNPQELLTPSRLASAEHFDTERPGELSDAARRLIAESRQAMQRAEEERARRIAELQAAKERAEDEQRRAVASAQEARDQLRIAAALEAASDPTTCAAILRELERPSDSLLLRLNLAFELLRRPLSLYVLPEESNFCFGFSADGSLAISYLGGERLHAVHTDGSAAPVGLPIVYNQFANIVVFPDGTRVAAVGFDNTVQIFGTDGRAATQVMEVGWRLCAISSAGDRLILQAQDGALRAWRIDGQGEPIGLSLSTSQQSQAAFSADGSRALSFAETGPVAIDFLDGSRPSILLDAQGGAVRSASFSPDGRRVLLVSADGTARIVSVDDVGTPVSLEEDPASVVFACFSPDGEKVLTASADAVLRLHAADGSGAQTVLYGYEGEVVSACFSPDGSRIATLSDDGTVCIGEADGSVRPERLYAAGLQARSVKFCDDGERVCVLWVHGGGRIYSLRRMNVLRRLSDSDAAIAAASFSPGGGCAFTLSEDGIVRLWNLRTALEPVLCGSPEEAVRSACVSPDERQLLAVMADGTARIHQLPGQTDTQSLPIVLRIAKKRVCMACYTSAGQEVFLLSSDGVAQVGRRDGSGKPAVQRIHAGEVQQAFASRDGSCVLVSFADGAVRLLIIAGTIVSLALMSHPLGVHSADFSHDGRRFVTASDEPFVRVYDLPADPEENADPLAPSMQCQLTDETPVAVHLSGDGARLLIRTSQSRLQLVQLDGALAPAVVRRCDNIAESALSPDGRHLVFRYVPGALCTSPTEPFCEALILYDSSESARFVISPDGGSLLVFSGGKAALHPLSPERLVERLWEATPYCLPIEERMRRLGETQQQAEAWHEAARRRTAR